jgi:hypothetical protein
MRIINFVHNLKKTFEQFQEKNSTGSDHPLPSGV